MTSAVAPVEFQFIGLTEGGDAGDLLIGLDQKQGREAWNRRHSAFSILS